MSRETVIAIDVGGTNLKGGLVDRAGILTHFRHTPSLAALGFQQLTARLKEFIRDYLNEVELNVAGIGIGFPGAIDTARGVITLSPNLPGANNAPVKEILEREFNLPVYLENDANAYALGEWWQGAGQGYDSLACLTLGTGVGGGLILGGKLWRGAKGMAGEVGHIVINSRGPRCGCGSRGCLETYASAIGLKRMMGDALRRLNDEDRRRFYLEVMSKEDIAGLSRLARDRDPLALQVYQRMGEYLGVGLASLINLLNLKLIILGGGVAAAWDYFAPTAWTELKSRAFPEATNNLKLLPAALGDRAGILGNAYLAWNPK